jgi:hypothetical protein
MSARPEKAPGLLADLARGLSTAELKRLVDRDASRAYSVLMRDQEAPARRHTGLRRVFQDARLLFRSVAQKLSPGRRFLFAVGVGSALLGAAGFDVDWRNGNAGVTLDGSPLFYALSIASLLFLLVLELVDRVLVRDELQVARQLQRDLLPKGSPELDGFAFAHSTRMANDIGGDYYRFEPLADGRLAVVVADASGHGMAAGLLMAIADATLHLAIDIDPSPMAVAGRLHKALRRTEDRRSFLTLFYGLLDPSTGELDYVCAGHPFPLVRRASGEIEEPRLGSFPLGLRERLAPATGRLTLAPGDLLVLFSDGLFEGLGASGDAFGFERLRGAIAAAKGAVDAHRRVLDAFARHTAGQPLADDLTLLAVERRAAPPLS